MSTQEPKAGDPGYCPMCDTVTDHGRCRCYVNSSEHIQADNAKATEIVNSVGNREPVMRVTAKEQTELCNKIWNDAIAVCAAEVGKEGYLRAQYLIRKLKK